MLSNWQANVTGDSNAVAPYTTGTLRWAVYQASQATGTNIDTVSVSGALLSSGNINLQQGPMNITRPMTIQGNSLSITGSSTVFDINVVGGPVGTVQISGFNMSSSGTDVSISALSEAQSALISNNTFSSGVYGIRSYDGIFSQLQISGNTFKTSYGVYIDGDQFTSNQGSLEGFFGSGENSFGGSSSGVRPCT